MGSTTSGSVLQLHGRTRSSSRLVWRSADPVVHRGVSVVFGCRRRYRAQPTGSPLPLLLFFYPLLDLVFPGSHSIFLCFFSSLVRFAEPVAAYQVPGIKKVIPLHLVSSWRGLSTGQERRM